MNGFSQAVSEKLGVYVYRLIDARNGETFYVGKGRGNRVFQHAAGVLMDAEPETEKLSRIHAIKLAGFDVAHVIHRHGMDDATAFEVEAALMQAYPGLTNIAGGHGSDQYGVQHASEITRRYEAPIAEFRHRVLLLTVDKLAAEASLYDATRYAWRLDASKAERVDYILPVVQGLIRGAYVAEQWLPATEKHFPGKIAMPGRFGFVGHEAPPEIVGLYAHTRIPEAYRKRGAANPARYVDPAR